MARNQQTPATQASSGSPTSGRPPRTPWRSPGHPAAAAGRPRVPAPTPTPATGRARPGEGGRTQQHVDHLGQGPAQAVGRAGQGEPQTTTATTTAATASTPPAGRPAAPPGAPCRPAAPDEERSRGPHRPAAARTSGGGAAPRRAPAVVLPRPEATRQRDHGAAPTPSGAVRGRAGGVGGRPGRAGYRRGRACAPRDQPGGATTTAKVRDVLVRALSSDLKLEVAETTTGATPASWVSRPPPTASTSSSPSAATARSTRPSTVCWPAGPGRTSRPWPWCPAGPPTSSAAPWAAPATRWRPPPRSWTPCGPGAPAGSPSAPPAPRWPSAPTSPGVPAGRRRAGSSSPRGSASTPTSSAGRGAARPGPALDRGLYVRAGTRAFLTGADRRRPPMTLHVPASSPARGLFLCLVSNVNPWTYLGDRAHRPEPRGRLRQRPGRVRDGPLGAVRMLGHLRATMADRPDVRGRSVHGSTTSTSCSSPPSGRRSGSWTATTSAGHRAARAQRPPPAALEVVV